MCIYTYIHPESVGIIEGLESRVKQESDSCRGPEFGSQALVKASMCIGMKM